MVKHSLLSHVLRGQLRRAVVSPQGNCQRNCSCCHVRHITHGNLTFPLYLVHPVTKVSKKRGLQAVYQRLSTEADSDNETPAVEQANLHQLHEPWRIPHSAEGAKQLRLLSMTGLKSVSTLT